eukprot:SAG11_NODE_5453_length_1555_cov_1.385989_2_plen_44_part_00
MVVPELAQGWIELIVCMHLKQKDEENAECSCLAEVSNTREVDK